MDGAIAEFRTAVRINPNDARWYMNLGVAILKKGDQRRAREQVGIACSLEPKNSEYCKVTIR